MKQFSNFPSKKKKSDTSIEVEEQLELMCIYLA